MIYVCFHGPAAVPDELLGPFAGVSMDRTTRVLDEDGVEVARLQYGWWRPVDDGLTYGHAYEVLDVVERST